MFGKLYQGKQMNLKFLSQEILNYKVNFLSVHSCLNSIHTISPLLSFSSLWILRSW